MKVKVKIGGILAHLIYGTSLFNCSLFDLEGFKLASSLSWSQAREAQNQALDVLREEVESNEA